MGLVNRPLGRGFVAGYGVWVRMRSKAFSLLASGGFAAFGARSVIQPPVRLVGTGRITVGSDVFLGAGCWLQVLGDEGRLEIGDGTSVVGDCVFSAARAVIIGERVLMARGVYVSDHSHAFDDPTRAVLDQGITKVAVVRIDDGVWLGENVVVGPGVHIGRGAVVGANSVVLHDVPAHAVAVGAPARVVRRSGPAADSEPSVSPDA